VEAIMKTVILAGGFGTRLGEDTAVIPKPMIRVGEYPIIWHIMKIYAHYGFNEFVVLCGYKNEVIRDYFLNYHKNNSDISIDYKSGSMEIHSCPSEEWKVTLLNTGRNDMTGSRLRKAKYFLENERFLLTYGDGVSDINVTELIKFHDNEEKLVTLTAIKPGGRFGALEINQNAVTSFVEKKNCVENWVNGGFFVVEPDIFNYIPDGENAIFECDTLSALAESKRLSAYKHSGFWHCMDTPKDKADLNAMWNQNKAPWKVW
jgi:glucose-1-phosphate cytidylyltransferase